MPTTKLDFDFMAHRERCNTQIYQAVHSKPYPEQLKYYRERILQSQLAQFWQSLQRKA